MQDSRYSGSEKPPQNGSIGWQRKRMLNDSIKTETGQKTRQPKERKKMDSKYEELVYKYIKNYIEKNGFSPTFDEISVGAGIPSKATVYDVIGRLEQRGKIRCALTNEGHRRSGGILLVKEQ